MLSTGHGIWHLKQPLATQECGRVNAPGVVFDDWELGKIQADKLPLLPSLPWTGARFLPEGRPPRQPVYTASVPLPGLSWSRLSVLSPCITSHYSLPCVPFLILNALGFCHPNKTLILSSCSRLCFLGDLQVEDIRLEQRKMNPTVSSPLPTTKPRYLDS